MKKAISILFSLVLTLSVFAQDNCDTAIPVTQGVYSTGEINGQTHTFVCTGDPALNAEWYSYTPTSEASVTVTTDLPQNGGTDTRIQVYYGFSCWFMNCLTGDDDGGNGLSSTVEFNVYPGNTYFIVFDNYWTSDAFDFEVTIGQPAAQPIMFSPTSPPFSEFAPVIVDMNGDHLDDMVSPSTTSIKVAEQQMDGSFVIEEFDFPNTANSNSWSTAAGDIDGNGFMDFVYGGGSGVTFMFATDDGTGYEETSGNEYVFSQRSNCVDINNDGHLDAFVCHDVEPNVYYINDGTGNLTFYQGGLGDTPDGGNYGSVWIDYDNDCDIDLFLAKCRGGNGPANINQLHKNNGDGTFSEVGMESNLYDNIQTWSSAWADFDRDGDMDVYVGASSVSNGSHKLMQNNGDGTFTDVTQDSGIDLFTPTSTENAPGDFNNDGHVDIFAAGQNILLNNGDMTFTPVSIGFSIGAFGDLNNDGFLDVRSGSFMYLNDGNDNNYLKVNTTGTISNVDGIGCRITLTSASGEQIREVRSGEGFRYMSTLTAHFGLGEDDVIEKVKVHWPSGMVDEIINPPINSTIDIIEGSSPVSISEESSDRVSLYPNPVEDVVQIDGLPSDDRAIVTVFDMNGKRVFNDPLIGNVLDLSRLESGLYLLRIEQSGIFMEKKLTKR